MVWDASQQWSQQKPQSLLKQWGHWMKKAQLSVAFFEDWKKARKKARKKEEDRMKKGRKRVEEKGKKKRKKKGRRKGRKKEGKRKSIVATSRKLRPWPAATTQTQSKLQSHHTRCQTTWKHQYLSPFLGKVFLSRWGSLQKVKREELQRRTKGRSQVRMKHAQTPAPLAEGAGAPSRDMHRAPHKHAAVPMPMNHISSQPPFTVSLTHKEQKWLFKHQISVYKNTLFSRLLVKPHGNIQAQTTFPSFLSADIL